MSADIARAPRLPDHPFRRKLLQVVAEREGVRWKKLRGVVGAGTGTLYHRYLDVMEDLICRDHGGRLRLTSSGAGGLRDGFRGEEISLLLGEHLKPRSRGG